MFECDEEVHVLAKAEGLFDNRKTMIILSDVQRIVEEKYNWLTKSDKSNPKREKNKSLKRRVKIIRKNILFWLFLW